MDSEAPPRLTAALAAGIALLVGAGWLAHGADQAWAWPGAGAALLGGVGLVRHAARTRTAPVAPLEVPVPLPPETARANRLDTWIEFAPVALFVLDTPAADGAPHTLNTAARRLLEAAG